MDWFCQIGQKDHKQPQQMQRWLSRQRDSDFNWHLVRLLKRLVDIHRVPNHYRKYMLRVIFTDRFVSYEKEAFFAEVYSEIGRIATVRDAVEVLLRLKVLHSTDALYKVLAEKGWSQEDFMSLPIRYAYKLI